ncbi:hypothetical protein NKG94_31085 [Micromonospora sp. M12]
MIDNLAKRLTTETVNQIVVHHPASDAAGVAAALLGDRAEDLLPSTQLVPHDALPPDRARNPRYEQSQNAVAWTMPATFTATVGVSATSPTAFAMSSDQTMRSSAPGVGRTAEVVRIALIWNVALTGGSNSRGQEWPALACVDPANHPDRRPHADHTGRLNDRDR